MAGHGVDRAIEGVDEELPTRPTPAILSQRWLHGVHLERSARATDRQVEEAMRRHRQPSLHLRLARTKDLGVLVGGAILVEHIGGEVNGFVVEANHREVGAIGRAQRHVEGIDVPCAARVAGLADPDPVNRLKGAIIDPKSAFHLKRGGDEAPVIGIVKRAWITDEGQVATTGARVGDAEEVADELRIAWLEVAMGVEDAKRRVHTLEDPRGRGRYRHVGGIAADWRTNRR